MTNQKQTRYTWPTTKVIREVLLTVFLVFTGFAMSSTANAQISLSPTIVFIHENDPNGRITIRNSSDTVHEVSINARFGYQASDEDGNLQLVYDDEEKALKHGLNEYLRIFPRRFLLEPGEFQRIQLTVNGIGTRPDGLYWTRLEITSSEILPDVEREQEERIGTRISYRIRQNIGVFFHKGNVNTALKLNNLQTRREADDLIVEMNLESGGNSPFLGSLQARILDSNGNEVKNGEWLFSVFGTRYWPHIIDVSGLNPGRYRLELEFFPERSDVRNADLPPADRLKNAVFIEL